jgi:O-acetylserine/cysteine efflux transporter
MSAVAPRHLGFLLAITLIWGLNLVVSKVGVESIPPLLFTTLRFTALALPLVFFLRIVPGKMSAMVVAALFSGALNFALMFGGIALAEDVSSVAIAGQLGIPFTTLLSVALLGETVRWRRWLGIALSFAGVMIMGLDPQVFAYWPALALVIGSAFVGSLGVIAVKKLPEFSPLEIQAWFSWFSLPALVALTWALERPTADTIAGIDWRGWAAIGYTAWVASLVAHTGFYYLLQRYPVTSVAPLTVLSPVFSVAFGVTLLGDHLTPRLAAGGLVTLSGVLIITARERRLADTGT